MVTATTDDGPVEMWRHLIVGAGQTSIVEAHYPERGDPARRVPLASKPGEAAFLRIGTGAGQWLVEAAATAGASNRKWRTRSRCARSMAPPMSTPRSAQRVAHPDVLGWRGQASLLCAAPSRKSCPFESK